MNVLPTLIVLGRWTYGMWYAQTSGPTTLSWPYWSTCTPTLCTSRGSPLSITLNRSPPTPAKHVYIEWLLSLLPILCLAVIYICLIVRCDSAMRAAVIPAFLPCRPFPLYLLPSITAQNSAGRVGVGGCSHWDSASMLGCAGFNEPVSPAPLCSDRFHSRFVHV
jgi:hypothetical protein